MTHHDDENDRRTSHEGADPKQRGGDGAAGAPPKPGGLASGLQPGGTVPGKSPGAGVGSLGTGGGSTGNSPSGAAKKGL